MSGSWFTVDFSLGKIVVDTGPGGVIRGIRFDLKNEVARRPSRTREAELIGRYLAGERVSLEIGADLAKESPFRRKVYGKVMEIPFGETRTYGEVAALAGCPKGARSVGQAMAANRFPLVIPCHRVLSAGGNLGGFSSGLEVKKFLLSLEGSFP